MADLERIGVSLEKTLLESFDNLLAVKGYQSRSEAIRDLVRQQLNQERIENPKIQAAGIVFLVYDHHAAQLSKSLIEIQHSHTHSNRLQIISSLHIHLDKHDCLEIIVLRGQAGEIKKVADNILSMKGVKLGKVSLI